MKFLIINKSIIIKKVQLIYKYIIIRVLLANLLNNKKLRLGVMKIKYYIIFTGNISDVGGAQLYIKNKCKYLINNGYYPIIITGNNSNIKINDFFYIKNLLVQELVNPIYYYNKRERNCVLNKITTFINDIRDDDSVIYIESHNLYSCTWAEKIAEIYETINIVYYLSEENIFKLNLSYYNFIMHKISNNQFVTVSSRSSIVIFGKEKARKLKIPYINVPFSISEFSKNVSQELIDRMNNIFSETESIKILTVSRLEKGYILPLIDSIGNLSNMIEKKVCLIIVGDSAQKGLLQEYKKKYENNTSKKRIEFLGYVYPLNKELFYKSDLFVGMGTAVINSISVGCPAICVDPRNNMSSGIFGIDLDNFAYQENLANISLEQDIFRLLNDLELNIKAIEKSIEIYNEEYEFNSVMNKFMGIISENKNKKYEYYNFKYKFSGVKDILRLIFSRTIGMKYYEKLARLICSIF